MNTKRSDLLLPGLGGLGLCLVVYIAALIGENHFRLLDGLCNGSLEVEPHQGIGAITDCTLNTTAYSIAVYAHWASIVIGALAALLVILGLVSRPELLEGTDKHRTPPSTGRPRPRTATPLRSSSVTSTARAGGVQHLRCPTCTTPNDVTSGEVRCFSCGAALQA